MNKLLYLFAILLLASCSTVQKGGIIQSRTYKFKPHQTLLADASKHRKTKAQSIKLAPLPSRTVSAKLDTLKINPQLVGVQDLPLSSLKLSDLEHSKEKVVLITPADLIELRPSLIHSLNAIDTLPPQTPTPTTRDERKTHWAAVVGLISGISCWVAYPIILSIFAIVFSSIALSDISRNPDVYKGQVIAIMGLALGIGLLIFSLIAILIYLSFFLSLL